MRATTTSSSRARAWLRLGAAGLIVGLAAGGLAVLPTQRASASTGNTYYVNSATDTAFTTLADLGTPATDCTSPTNTGCGIDDAIEFFNSDTTPNNADTIVFSSSITTFTEGQPTTVSNTTAGVTLAINGNGPGATQVHGTFGGFGVFTIFAATAVTMSGLTLADGNAKEGGGVANFGSNLTITNSTISGNSALGGDGGGIVNDGTLTVTNSTISGNTSVTSGGGIANDGGTATVTDSTISGNTATNTLGDIYHGGGGIYNGGTLTLTGSTVAGNTGTNANGILNFGTVNLAATIMANGLTNNECSGTITDEGYNIADDSTCAFSATGSVNASTTLDGSLGALGTNGGTTETILPVPTSPVVGAIPTGTTLNSVSVCPRTDQRGVASTPGTNCTIGSVEVPSSLPASQLSALGQAVQGVGPGTSLGDKVTNAENELSAGDVRGTCGALRAFVHEVGAQTRKHHISAGQAVGLVLAAQAIESELSC